MTVSRSRSAVVISTLAFILLPVLAEEGHRAAAPAGGYSVTDLGTLGGGSAQAFDVNEAGQVVGYATTSASQAHAFLWQDGVMRDLGTLGGTFAQANAINASGHVAGESRAADSGASSRAALWRDGGVTNLTPDLPLGDGATAYGVNDAGQVVGTINHWTGFVWQNGVRSTLGHLGGGGSLPRDINAAGQVVGSSYTTHATALGLMTHAFLWENGVITDLGLFPGDDDSFASAINSFGQIVGWSGRTDPETYATTYRPFLYSGGVMTAIPVPSFDSYAGDINDEGVVVGTMRAGGGLSKYHAWIYADGVVTNLNTLIPSGTGLHMAFANSINNAGQIAGIAYDAQGRYHAVLLNPTGEPPPPVEPRVSIGDVSRNEGQSGSSQFVFTVTLDRASAAAVSVSFATADGSARATDDYVARSGALVFNAGETSKTVVVSVRGDRKREEDEVFYVNLSGVAGAVAADSQGIGVVRNDDK